MNADSYEMLNIHHAGVREGFVCVHFCGPNSFDIGGSIAVSGPQISLLYRELCFALPNGVRFSENKGLIINGKPFPRYCFDLNLS